MTRPASPDEVTPEVVGEFGRRATLTLAIGLGAVLVLANVAALILLRLHPVNRGNWLVHEKWNLLDRAPRVDTLILGDSSCNQGVLPAVLDQELGATSLNLCTVANMLVINDSWMLGEYIAKHGPPKRVVVVHVYDMWSRTKDYAFVRLAAKIPRPWGFWHELTPPLDFNNDDLEDVISSRYLPLHSETRSLLSWFLSGSVRATRFVLDERGFMNVEKADSAQVEKDLKKHLTRLAQKPLAMSDLNRSALAQLDAMARRYQIEMTIAFAPMYEALWAHPEAQQRLAEIRASIQSALGPSSPVRVLDGPQQTFPASQMENVDHVVADAARVYTKWLADKIRR